MLILGATSDDKGAQLEALLETILLSQGYTEVRRNLITAGGNEIDVSAVRESPVLTKTQSTPLICEAKAYASALSMPTWHKFLGKLHLARVENASTVGMLVALSGVNGNVAGSHMQLAKSDPAVFIVEGRDVAKSAKERGEIADAAAVRDALSARFSRIPVDLDVAYYNGAYYWVSRWDDGTYSVVDGQAVNLTAQRLSTLTAALQNSLTGTLVASEDQDADAELEACHAVRVEFLNRMFYGEHPPVGDDPDEVTAAVAQEPFCALEEGHLRLLRPEEMDAEAISRLFLALFEHRVTLADLTFIADRLHEPYVDRLIDLMSEIHRGFTLDAHGEATLREIAPLFPTLWLFLSRPYGMITTHRDGTGLEENEDVRAADTNSFWAEVIGLVKADYVNPALRGLLYDHLDVAELATRTEVVVKTKGGIAGEMTSVVRDAVRQMDAEEFGGKGVVHVAIRMLSAASEPWDDLHPEPADQAVEADDETADE